MGCGRPGIGTHGSAETAAAPASAATATDEQNHGRRPPGAARSPAERCGAIAERRATARWPAQQFTHVHTRPQRPAAADGGSAPPRLDGAALGISGPPGDRDV